MRTLSDLLLDSERRFGARPALGIRRGLRTTLWSYGELAEAARLAAGRFRTHGLEPGDRVLTLAPNSPELVASMFGVWLAGGVLVPVDIGTTAEAIEGIREQAEPRLIIAGAPPAELSDLPAVSPFEIGNREPGVGGQGSHSPEGGRAAPLPSRTPEFITPTPDSRPLTPDLAEIVFTSGATGAPKGVTLSHANILANVGALLDAMPVSSGERLLSILPLSHMLEQTVGLLAALAAGATVFYTESRRSTAIVAALQRYRIGLLVCVPEVLKLLLAGVEREVERSGRLRQWGLMLGVAGRLPVAARPALFGSLHRRLGGRLRLVLCGGASLDHATWRTWELLGVRVIQGYGATECAPVVTSTRLERRPPGSVGWPLRGVEMRLAHDGEVLVRGPNVTSGYWRDAEATRTAFDDGWYRTGDLGALGRRGDLRLLGRKKEMIALPNGRNVFPEDVETELRREPSIKECVVVGKRGPDGAEQVHAVLIPSTGAEEAVAAVRRANVRLGSHQRVSGHTIWPELDFPRTPTLKIKRFEVLARIGQAAEERGGLPSVPAIADASPEEHLRGLLARATGRPLEQIRPGADLALDLGLDSLGRVELAAFLEEELGRSLADEEMAALRTVADLLAAIERAGSAGPVEPLVSWPRQAPARLIRELAQRMVLFPLLRAFCRPLSSSGGERLAALSEPVLLIANHTSHLDSLLILSLLEPARRRRIAVAAAADYFFKREPLATFSALALGAFPFQRHGGFSKSLSHCGDLADDGYSLLVFPEGTRSTDSRLQPFKPGVGLLGRELGLPVVPVHIAGLHAVLPKGSCWPRPGPVRVAIGEPLRLERGLSNAEATEILESAMRSLEASGAD